MNLWAVTTPSLSPPPMVSLSPRKHIITVNPLLNCRSGRKVRIEMRDRSKNRKPLQRGRNLSIEAIQTIQVLKRANTRNDDGLALDRAFDFYFKRLLKLDMMAVLQELLRQNECQLALKVFEDVQKEHWYKPRASLYAEIISALGRQGLYETIELFFAEMKMESRLEPDIKGFNVLMHNLICFNATGLAMECFSLMKSLGCEPDRSTYRILINGLESKGEPGLSATLRQEAEKFYGNSLEFLNEEELVTS